MAEGASSWPSSERAVGLLETTVVTPLSRATITSFSSRGKIMSHSDNELIREFFVAIAKGGVGEEMLTPDMTFWSINGGLADKARFQGAMTVLASIYRGTLTYDIVSLTGEEDRIVAEVSSHGTLASGESIQNDHVFLFRIREGRIASVREFMNQLVVREKIAPLMQAAMAESRP